MAVCSRRTVSSLCGVVIVLAVLGPRFVGELQCEAKKVSLEMSWLESRFSAPEAEDALEDDWWLGFRAPENSDVRRRGITRLVSLFTNSQNDGQWSHGHEALG